MKTRYSDDPKDLYQKCYDKDEKRIEEEELNFHADSSKREDAHCKYCKYPKWSPHTMIVTCKCNK